MEFDTKRVSYQVLHVCQVLKEHGFEAVLVGGSVRDLLIGRDPGDFDVATSAYPDQVMHLFGSRYAVPTGLQHGTVTVDHPDPRGRPRQAFDDLRDLR